MSFVYWQFWCYQYFNNYQLLISQFSISDPSKQKIDKVDSLSDIKLEKLDFGNSTQVYSLIRSTSKTSAKTSVIDSNWTNKQWAVATNSYLRYQKYVQTIEVPKSWQPTVILDTKNMFKLLKYQNLYVTEW